MTNGDVQVCPRRRPRAPSSRRMSLVQVAQRAADLYDRAAAFYGPARPDRPRSSARQPAQRCDLDGVRLLLDTGAPSALLYLRVDGNRRGGQAAAPRGARRGAARDLPARRRHPRAGGLDEWQQAFVQDPGSNLVGLVRRSAPDRRTCRSCAHPRPDRVLAIRRRERRTFEHPGRVGDHVRDRGARGLRRSGGWTTRSSCAQALRREPALVRRTWPGRV